MKVWCMNSMDWEEHSCYLGENDVVYQEVQPGVLIPSRYDSHFPIFDERIIMLVDKLKKEIKNVANKKGN